VNFDLRIRIPRRTGPSTLRSRILRSWILSAWVALATLGCSGEADPGNTAGDGHSRMIALLEALDLEARKNNPYLGDAAARELRSALASLPNASSDPQRLKLNLLLGREELRLGNVEKAIECLAEGVRQAEALKDQVPEEVLPAILFDLGVANLRLWVERNCLMRDAGESCVPPVRADATRTDPGATRDAIECFARVLKLAPKESELSIKSRWLLNIAYMYLDGWPNDVPREHRIAPRVFASAEKIPRFTNVAPRLGLDVLGLAGGAVVDDFDGDDLCDIMVTGSSTGDQMRYFRNNGDGTFSDLTERAGLLGLRGGLNMVSADYDNDGKLDVLVLRGAWGRNFGRHPNSLLRNNGDGAFRDVTFESGLAEVHCPTQTAAWADYDNDGDLDLYVGNEMELTTPCPCQLFRNNGDGTFTDVAAQAGVENRRFTKAVVWGDYDGDRLPDLFVANMSGANRLYHNEGDGTFTDVAVRAGVDLPVSAFPSWFWDFDNDGALDLFVGAFGGESTRPNLLNVAASYLGLPHSGELDRLYRGDGRGRFADVARSQGLTRYTLPMGANYGDLDSDGFLDFYLGTGFPSMEGLMPNVMYRNLGGIGFADVTVAGGFGHLQKGHGIAFADVDNDGDTDVFEEMGGAFPGDAFRNVLYENPGFGNHWIKVKLIGVQSNRSAIGARIKVDVVDDSGRRSIYRHVSTGGSFGCNPLRQEIGLGGATMIERLEVSWPTTGRTQVFTDVAMDQLVEITEGQVDYRVVPVKQLSFGP